MFFSLVLLGGGSGLGDGDLALGDGQLDVARGAHVGTSATVGAVGTTAHAGGLVDLDVGDDELVDIDGLFLGVGFGVLQESEHRDDALAGPATLGGAGEFLSLGGAADLAVVTLEGDAAGLGEDLAVVLLGLAERQTLDRVGGLEGVLEVAGEVGDLSEGSLGGDTGLAGILDHFESGFLFDFVFLRRAKHCRFENLD